MAKKRRSFRRSRGSQRGGGPRSVIGLRPVDGSPGSFELVHPRGVRERAEDLEEVEAMIEAGELDIARDELLWLVDECREFILAHRLLGELAAEAGDWRLARGHFGFAWQLGIDALPQGSLMPQGALMSQGGRAPQGGKPGTLPYVRPDNQAFLEAGKGLVYCLQQQGAHDHARQVIDQLLRLDPSDPLGVRAMRGQTAGLTIVELPGEGLERGVAPTREVTQTPDTRPQSSHSPTPDELAP